jgi:hypothetical protein
MMFYFTVPTPRQLTYMHSSTPRAISPIVPAHVGPDECLGSYNDTGTA